MNYYKIGYSTLSLGYIGIYEVTKAMTGVSHTVKEGHNFAIKLMKKLNDTIKKWNKDSNLAFTLYATPSNSLRYKFAKIDKEQFGTIKDITDKGYYTDSYFLDNKENMELLERLKFESEFQDLSNGGALSYIALNSISDNLEDLENIIQFVYNNIQYVEFK